MRFALALLALGTAFHGQSAAAAQATDVKTLSVNGDVPGVCTIGEPRLAAGGQNNIRGLDGSLLQVDQLVDPETLSTRAASVEVTFDSFCTSAHRLIMESRNNGMFREPGGASVPPSGFGYGVPYLATAYWGPKVLMLRADASTRRIQQDWVGAGPQSGELRLDLEIKAGATNERPNAPLMAGIYTDILRITLEPRQ